MCWLPTDQPLLLPGDSICAQTPSPCSMAQLLASRLRRIGDQLEKSWTPAAAGEPDSGYSCGGEEGRLHGPGPGHFKGFICAAIHITVLVLFVTRRRHL